MLLLLFLGAALVVAVVIALLRLRPAEPTIGPDIEPFPAPRPTAVDGPFNQAWPTDSTDPAPPQRLPSQRPTDRKVVP
jgi:hypothetical protein